MSKSKRQMIVLNIKGSEKAVEGTTDMVDSVVDALRSQFPKMKIESTTIQETELEKPIVMVGTKFHKADK